LHTTSLQVMAFVAPKIIGGLRAPTPVGELGFVEMTQAVDLTDVSWTQVRSTEGHCSAPE
jgi:diaminohydroxyphosphoribosylaminopyrimidine deaminase/5-amino-6-(5-phosphoribosylamino)uracil reductase